MTVASVTDLSPVFDGIEADVGLQSSHRDSENKLGPILNSSQRKCRLDTMLDDTLAA